MSWRNLVSPSSTLEITVEVTTVRMLVLTEYISDLQESVGYFYSITAVSDVRFVSLVNFLYSLLTYLTQIKLCKLVLYVCSFYTIREV
jgi:hypothetical protein